MAERRKRSDEPVGTRSGEDRRVIERFSNPRIAGDLKHIQLWVRGMALIILTGAVARVVASLFSETPRIVAYEAFLATTMLIFVVLLFKYAYSIGLFLKNESVQNLEISHERQYDFWKGAGILMFIFTVINFIFSY